MLFAFEAPQDANHFKAPEPLKRCLLIDSSCLFWIVRGLSSLCSAGLLNFKCKNQGHAHVSWPPVLLDVGDASSWDFFKRAYEIRYIQVRRWLPRLCLGSLGSMADHDSLRMSEASYSGAFLAFESSVLALAPRPTCRPVF